MPEPLRVVIADDQALLRGSFRLLVDSEPDMAVVGEAATGAEAVEVVQAARPDVVLMDVRMPGMDGIAATRLLTERVPSARVLILTMFDLDSHVFDALRAGAAGFLLKDTRPADLCAAIRVVASGEALLAPAVTRRLIAEFARTTAPRPALSRDLDVLTPRETEVLTLIAHGLSNTELAERLHLSLATVKTYIGRLLAKLHARDRAQLVVIAYETGLVTASGARSAEPR
ncbi:MULTISPECIES: response regulator transcription factor [Amycolatopsis]|uniref:Response regulator transcription factor n=1 Tax=Amycolatopsis tucumanensis TaxID=401106 RepID=A0ABP7JE72_9PSEU|nr:MULTISPECIES: response regulator transcription factor [Amycolatopsis]MCF6425987.1 response regulator transcription factor [Amycolatopsis tucumanensis]